MVTAQAFTQLKAFARQDGAILALVWIISFASMMYGQQTPWGSLLAMLTPFVVWWRLTAFRNSALDGVISFRRGLAYSWYTFFYASVIFAIIQYVYFRYLDHGVFSTMTQQTLATLAPIYRQNGVSTADLTTALSEIKSLKPIQLAFIFLMQDLLIGAILSFPIAAVSARKTPRTHKNQI